MSSNGAIWASSAPKWLKVGTFVEYTFNSNGILFSNGTHIPFDNIVPTVYRWDCIELNETMAVLNVSLDFKKENGNMPISGEIAVGLSNRSVYLPDGTLIGTSLFWTLSNPVIGTEVILWDVPPDKITATVSEIAQDHPYVFSPTPQGRQKAFYLHSTGTVNGSTKFISIACDVDTGVTTDGFLELDPSFEALNLNSPGRLGSLDFTDTNIDLGPSENSFEIQSFLPVLAIVAGSIIIFVMVYRNQRKH